MLKTISYRLKKLEKIIEIQNAPRERRFRYEGDEQDERERIEREKNLMDESPKI